MSYYYEYTFSDLAEFLSSPEGMAVAGVVLFFLAFLAVQYVFQSLSLYAIAGCILYSAAHSNIYFIACLSLL